MFDIGIGEILLIAVVGLLVFGPEKLPKAAADAGRLLRQVRAMAAGARQELAESAGLDLSEAGDVVRDLSDLHPRRLMAGLLDDPGASPASTQPGGQDPAARGTGSTAGPAPGTGTRRTGEPASGGPIPPAAFDPDAT